MLFSNAEGSEMMRPMTIVMITGMIVSTVITLLFTPVYYSLVDSLGERFAARRQARRDRRGRHEPPAGPSDGTPVRAGAEKEGAPS